MSKPASSRVPLSLFVLIVIILGGMYYYAAFVAFSNPEDTVRNFYEAYFNEDFNKAAENVSVFGQLSFCRSICLLNPGK
jgi:uncharacterized membrane protein YvbJ